MLLNQNRKRHDCRHELLLFIVSNSRFLCSVIDDKRIFLGKDILPVDCFAYNTNMFHVHIVEFNEIKQIKHQSKDNEPTWISVKNENHIQIKKLLKSREISLQKISIFIQHII